jgi:tRNA-2-methylthio-N6-dimethylallyladenosine synthase
MRRSYRSDRYLGIIERVRELIPHAAISTDIIVGFPGETETDFAATMDVVREARFAAAFTFQYSPRPGTPAATMPNQVPAEVVTDRYNRLVELANEIVWQENKKLLGTEVEVMISEVHGKKDGQSDRLTGRARDNRLVHVARPPRETNPGDFVTARVTHAAPYHLIADDLVSVRPARNPNPVTKSSSSNLLNIGRK